jgi:Major Facilitator Superfamily
MMDISSVKSRLFSAAPEGTAALFFIQIFSTLGFAVLYSTLVLYATKHLQLGVKEATTLMGVFGAFNYGLHLFGGYLGGRFLSNRKLFVGSMAVQVIGCACIASGTLALFYVGLALFLTGSGLNVTCINMMLTQRFTPEDPRREGAFLWNYAGMNVGFFVGFSVAGYFQATQSYSSLFIFATLGNFVAIILAVFMWKTLADRNTTLLDATPKQFRLRQLAGIVIVIGLVPVVWFMLQRPRRHGNDHQSDLRRRRGDADLLHGPPPGSPRAAEHDGLPDSDHRLADVLVALPDGAEWPDAVRGQQRRSDGRSREDSAAVDSEHQHRLHRARRAGARRRETTRLLLRSVWVLQ